MLEEGAPSVHSSQQTGRRRWARAAAESGLIIGSILLAFAIDAWWNTRGERKLEEAFLRGLVADVEHLNEELDRSITRQTQQRDEIVRLINEYSGGATVPDTIGRFSTTVFILRNTLATYKDLTASGGTARIQSIAVRRSLADLAALIDVNRAAEDWALDLAAQLKAVSVTQQAPFSRRQALEMLAAHEEVSRRLLLIRQMIREAAAVSERALRSALK